MHRRRAGAGRLRHFVIGLCCALGCGVLATAGWLATSSAAPGPGPGRVVNRGQVPGAATAQPAHRASVPGPPKVTSLASDSRLQLSRLGVDALIVGVSAPSGVMRVPADPSVLGWWTDGSSPGSGHGHVVIVGHINYHGQPGALAALPDVRPGDAVTVLARGSAMRYVVRAVRSYPKTAGLPSQVFAQDGPEELVLITCGGALDTSTGNYADNVVAYATSAG